MKREKIDKTLDEKTPPERLGEGELATQAEATNSTAGIFRVTGTGGGAR